MIHLLWFKMKLNYVQINVSYILFVFSMAFNIVFIYSLLRAGLDTGVFVIEDVLFHISMSFSLLFFRCLEWIIFF